MQGDKDLQNIAFDWPDTEPVANVHIDPNKARLLGIDSYAVSLHLQSLLSGTKSGEYYEGNQTIPVTFRLGGNEQHNLSALRPYRFKQATVPTYHLTKLLPLP